MKKADIIFEILGFILKVFFNSPQTKILILWKIAFNDFLLYGLRLENVLVWEATDIAVREGAFAS